MIFEDNKRKISNKITQKKDFDLPNNSFLMVKGSNSTGLNEIIKSL